MATSTTITSHLKGNKLNPNLKFCIKKKKISLPPQGGKVEDLGLELDQHQEPEEVREIVSKFLRILINKD